MKFNLNDAVLILERTPGVLKAYLKDLPDNWIKQNEGGESWSPFDIVGHLIHGEKTDWIPRTKIILEDGEERPFEPFDRFAQFENSKEENINELLDEFESLRKQNLRTLQSMKLTENDLQKKGIHPEFDTITLEQLLSTWVVHDLGHIRQISRVMAKLYKEEIGPWEKYLPVVEE